MNRFDIINRIGDKYRVGNTETGEFNRDQFRFSVPTENASSRLCIEFADEMDGFRICGNGTVLFLYRKSRNESCDCGILIELCYLFPVQQEYEALQSERAGEKSKV